MNEFYKSQSPMFKNDQKCPVCKQCLQDIYDENFQYYKDMEKALYKTLFSLDYYFDLKLCKRSLIDVYNNGTYERVVEKIPLILDLASIPIAKHHSLEVSVL